VHDRSMDGWIDERMDQPTPHNHNHIINNHNHTHHHQHTHYLTLRANPFPNVTDRFCRLPLPTFVHRPEAVHLGDRMRIAVRPSATTRNSSSLGPSEFHGPSPRLSTRSPRVGSTKQKKGGAFPAAPRLLRANRFRRVAVISMRGCSFRAPPHTL